MSGLRAARLTILSGSGTGKGRISTCSKIENIAVFAPIPSAIEMMAKIVTNGVLNSVRSANRIAPIAISLPGPPLPRRPPAYQNCSGDYSAMIQHLCGQRGGN
jgi:hypothetical protein